MSELSFRKLQHEAKEQSQRFLDEADKATLAREAADWAWAAKNSISVAVSCETILKIQNGGGR